MTTIVDEKLIFATPSFVSGADQKVPEIRASSIRGALRWWFRALGGSSKDETEVFGGVGDEARSSAIVVRTEMIEWKRGEKITFSPTSDKGYVYYFASKSGNDKGIYRTNMGSYFDVGTSFRLMIALRREISPERREILDLALRVFLLLGAIGLRATRGCGAFTAGNVVTRTSLRELAHELAAKKIHVALASSDSQLPVSGVNCQVLLAGFLRTLRSQTHCSGKHRSALGFSDVKARESSALRLRPVKTSEGFLPVVIYTDAACTQPSLWNEVERATYEI